MEKTEAEKILKEKLETAEKILVGIGSEWKKKEGTEEEEVLHAAEKLKNFLDGKDYYIITSLPGEDADRLGFSAGHMAVPLELGENYKDPSLIRWPFEKTAMLNNKAYLFRVHKIFSQVPEELSGKSCPVAEVSFKLVDDFLERV